MRDPAFRRRRPAPRVDLFLLALIGLGIAVYALASVTGRWLGTPPWWFKKEHMGSWGFTVAQDGRGWISVAVLVVGLALFARAVWRYRATRGFTRSLLVLGVALALYGTPAVTGGWLGRPLWWDREFRQDDRRSDGTATGYYDEGRIPREGRDLISVGVIVTGIAAVAVGRLAARRRRSRPSPESS